MKLRRATANDAKNLFVWRNDAETRANSRQQEPVSWEDHLVWIECAIDPGNPDNFVIIAEDDRGAIGMIRFLGRDGDNYEVSINIAPERRGEGNGGEFLKLACARMKGFLVAEIRSGNFASRKIFEQCGFEELSANKDFLLYRRLRREAV